jgi:hypothetical protein
MLHTEFGLTTGPMQSKWSSFAINIMNVISVSVKYLLIRQYKVILSEHIYNMVDLVYSAFVCTRVISKDIFSFAFAYFRKQISASYLITSDN